MDRIMLVCEDTFDGILTAVYEAWQHRGAQVNIRVKGEYNYDIFSKYITVPVDFDKSEKVMKSIRDKISEEALAMVYNVACSIEEDKCSAILGLLISGFAQGASITETLTNPYVQRCYDIQRRVSNESHFFLEILRFEELPGKLLCARISPRANVMVYVMEHFSDRFPEENFVIYDENRRICGIHERGCRYYLRNSIDLDKMLTEYRERMGNIPDKIIEDDYVDLWKVFFDSIAIEERKNSKLQRNNVPLLYRKHMTEFVS